MNKKLHTALKHGVVPVVCVGEVLAEREAGKTAEVLKTQITGAFVGITAAAAAPIVIAYEPVWAIGTGKTATPEIAVDAHKIIRAEVAKLPPPHTPPTHPHCHHPPPAKKIGIILQKITSFLSTFLNFANHLKNTF